MGRLRLHEREAVRALWRGHFEAWRLSGLTQREYCERHGLSLKSFGNWRGQLKREDVVGRDARWGRHPRLRHMVSPMASPMANEAADRVPAVVPRTGRRRQFSEEDKRLIVEEACRAGPVAVGGGTPLRHRPTPIVPVAASPGGWRISCADKLCAG